MKYQYYIIKVNIGIMENYNNMYNILILQNIHKIYVYHVVEKKI